VFGDSVQVTESFEKFVLSQTVAELSILRGDHVAAHGKRSNLVLVGQECATTERQNVLELG
jgi:hypothetical protein